MTEREMEDLLWEYPEKLLTEPLKQYQRQRQSSVGRADLIFTDRLGRLLVVEIKRGKLARGAINQLVDYFGMMKEKFPDKPVELMVVANSIPPERRLACEPYNIECREISEKKFRDVAEEVEYIFQSEKSNPSATFAGPAPDHFIAHNSAHTMSRLGNKVEKGWYYFTDSDGGKYFLAFVNAKGNCSIRIFDSENGRNLGKKYQSGDFQVAFRDYIKSGKPVHVSHQPNLEKHCKERLPDPILAELRRQIRN